MSKSEATTGLENEIEFDVVKSDFKKVLSAHKKYALQGKNVAGSVLSRIKFKIEGGTLTIHTTDGNRALETKMEVLANRGIDGEFTTSMELVSKLSLLKSELNEICIMIKNNKVEFFDYFFSSVQKFPIFKEPYPKVEDVIPSSKNRHKITVSQYLIKDIAALYTPTGTIDLYIDAKDNLKCILVKTGTEDVKQRALLMPFKKDSQNTCEDKE